MNGFVDSVEDIVNGLRFLHHLGVVHADLKPSNVLMLRIASKRVAKLTDFGLNSVAVSSDVPRAGTRRWNPPECLSSSEENLG